MMCENKDSIIIICSIYFYFQTIDPTSAAEDEHSIQLHEASLVTEAKKARPRLDVMKATMCRTAPYRAEKMKKATDILETLRDFPYLKIPSLVNIFKTDNISYPFLYFAGITNCFC